MCRVTKYNPLNRDELGNYPVNEWTSVSDIGHVFNGELLSRGAYMAAEDGYVRSIERFLHSSEVEFMECVDLEESPFDSELEGDNLELYQEFALLPLSNLDVNQVSLVARLVLRELLWCKLISSCGVQIHFGYDFNMFFVSPLDRYDFEPPDGIHVEPESHSPYLEL